MFKNIKFKLIDLFLLYLGMHSLILGISMLFFPGFMLGIINIELPKHAFYVRQSGIFHFIFGIGYLYALSDIYKNSILLVFIAISKFAAFIFLSSEYFFYDELFFYFLIGLLEGTMGVIFIILIKKTEGLDFYEILKRRGNSPILQKDDQDLYYRLLEIFLFLVALHSFILSILMLFFSQFFLGWWGVVYPEQPLFVRQSGIFLLIYAIAYWVSLLDIRKNMPMVIFAIISKGLAVIFLFSEFLYYHESYIYFLAGIGDGLMGLGLLVLLMKIKRNYSPQRHRGHGESLSSRMNTEVLRSF